MTPAPRGNPKRNVIPLRYVMIRVECRDRGGGKPPLRARVQQNMTTATLLHDLLGLKTAPVAITFRASAPNDLPRVASPGPSGCSYWKRAAEGQTFYTEAADHYNCPIGAYTHGSDMPAAQMQELQGVVGTNVALSDSRAVEPAKSA